jgi:hypothetical protein
MSGQILNLLARHVVLEEVGGGRCLKGMAAKRAFRQAGARETSLDDAQEIVAGDPPAVSASLRFIAERKMVALSDWPAKPAASM